MYFTLSVLCRHLSFNVCFISRFFFKRFSFVGISLFGSNFKFSLVLVYECKYTVMPVSHTTVNVDFVEHDTLCSLEGSNLRVAPGAHPSSCLMGEACFPGNIVAKA